MSLKERRKALGLGRADLAHMAVVDKRILQLLELGQSSDDESLDRAERALTALEQGAPMPDFQAEVKALMEAHGTHKLELPKMS